MSVVYCPRTHAFFGHEPYPLAELLQRGVRVALGTDSRASNPDLDMWTEMRFVARAASRMVSPEICCELAHAGRAQSLGAGESHSARSRPARRPTWRSWRSIAAARDPHERLLLDDSRVVADLSARQADWSHGLNLGCRRAATAGSW